MPLLTVKGVCRAAITVEADNTRIFVYPSIFVFSWCRLDLSKYNNNKCFGVHGHLFAR